MNRRSFNKIAGAATFSAASGFLLGAVASPALGAVPKGTDIRVVEADSAIERFEYRTPMKFGGRVLTDITLVTVNVLVESRDGRSARGSGSMTMGNIWAWPAGATSSEATLKALIAFANKKTASVTAIPKRGHPLELTHDYAESDDAFAAETVRELGITEPMPKLAQRVAASPLEAAVFDAYGRLNGENVCNLLSKTYCNRDLSAYLDKRFRGEYLDQYTLRKPKPKMPLYHLVGALDPLTPTEVAEPVGDGLPEDLAAWICYNGLTHLKIKLNGNDLDWDVQRTLAINRVAEEVQRDRGCSQWYYSADFNERCPDVRYVLDFFARIEEQSPETMARLQYIEQPTHRDLRAFPENRMHIAAKIKPVVIDESLLGFESLLESRQMGYSGVALKACKGFGDALLMGAAAQKFGMFLSVQDLTCPGASFLQSAALSARIPTVAAIEGNARQYCPNANKPWLEKYPTMFKTTDGSLCTAVLTGSGLY